MTKLDEIQERIRGVITSPVTMPTDSEIVDLLRDITAELKRIDAEQQRIAKDLAPPDCTGP